MEFDEAKWMRPMGIDDVTFQFPMLIKNYMPAFEEIPRDFRIRMGRDPEVTKWVKFQRDWFEYGFKSLKVVPREGIPSNMAVKHLAMIQKSFEPSHEHKVAAVAYLASLWLQKVEYTCEDKGMFGGPLNHR